MRITDADVHRYDFGQSTFRMVASNDEPIAYVYAIVGGMAYISGFNPDDVSEAEARESFIEEMKNHGQEKPVEETP